jgi:polyisoprenyl-phosphate glycosyltransferase
MNNNPQISIIVPLYNEEKVFSLLINRLNLLMDNSPFSIEIVLVDDGSKDSTPTLMSNLALINNRYQCVFLSRNYGHQIALTAGMNCASGDEAILVIDGDLQDPPELITDFYKKIKEGFDVAYGIRKKRKENIIKKSAYWIFYRLLKSLSNIEIQLDSGDFAMYSRRMIDHINKLPEKSRYIRGIRSWIGFRQIGIEYERDHRIAGVTKYNNRMLFKLAFNGIFNFSELPIRFITRLGLITVIFSLLYFAYTVYRKLIFNDVPTGFTALYFAISVFSGVQLISIGLIGEYLIRIYDQVRNRPLFIIDKTIKNKTVING